MTSTQNWCPDIESLLLELESMENTQSKFHIDTKAINARGSTTDIDIDILNQFKIEILKTSKDNSLSDDLLKFYKEVLIFEKWADKTQEDTDCTHDSDEDSESHIDDRSDEVEGMIDEQDVVAVVNDFCNGTLSFDKDRADVERRTEEDTTIYRRTVENENLKSPCRQGKDRNLVDRPTDFEIEEHILDADEHTFCKLPFAALAKKRPDILRICFQSDVDMNVFFGPEGRNLLMYAVSLPSVETSSLDILLGGINLQTRTSCPKQRTALTECLVNSKIDSDMKITVVRILLNAGITLESSGRFFSSPLHVYVDAIISDDYGYLESNWKEIIEELLKAGNNINATNFRGRTPLMDVIELIGPDDMEEAIERNEKIIRIAEYLLQNGADPDIRDFEGKSSMFYAVLAQNWTILKRILKYCNNTSIQDNMGMTTIYKVCSFIEGPYDDGDIENIIFPMLDALASAGCDINLQAIDMTTALHHSAAKQPREICEKLCAFGADTDKRDFLERTALHLAVRNEDTEVITCLLNYGADINARDKNNETPLHHACIFGNTEAAKMLVKGGANVEAQSVLGIRPAHLAAEHGDRGIIEYIMSIANHSAKDIYGAQVMHFAAADGNTETVEYLLRIGIDEKQCDQNGMRAIDFARYMGHLNTVQVLNGNGSVQFGNLPAGCFPNERLMDISKVDEYYKNLAHKFGNETVNWKPNSTESARKLLTSKGLGSVKFDRGEASLISDLVMTYADAFAKKIGELDPLFQCKLLRAGSTYEGVKTGYPDEFDFLCDLTAFREYIEHFEQGETEGFARVLLKEGVPDTVKRFRTGTSRYISSTQILRHFSKLALQAKFEVLNEANFKGHIYAGAALLPETSNIFDSITFYLSSLHSLTLSFRGAEYKHLYIDIDFNPVIFSNKFPDEANHNCRQLPNVSSRGIYVIPKLCNALGFPPENNMPPQPPLEEHWRFSTQHIEAEMMQRMPQIARDCYMVCKVFRMEPLACSVYYLEHGDNYLSDEELRKYFPHGSFVHEEEESETDSSASDEQEQMEADDKVEEAEIDTEFESTTSAVTKHMRANFGAGITESSESARTKTKSNNIVTIKDENKSEPIGQNVVEMTAEKVIPSYYIKSIFIKEMERMALDGEELSEDSILIIPRRVYQLLKIALKDGYLTTLLMPHHNMLKKGPGDEIKFNLDEMREKYCENILNLMDSLGFH